MRVCAFRTEAVPAGQEMLPLRTLCAVSTMSTAYKSAMILRSRKGTTRSRYMPFMSRLARLDAYQPIPAIVTMEANNAASAARRRARIEDIAEDPEGGDSRYSTKSI